MKLLTAEEYYEALLKVIPLAQKRIVIHAMVVLWGGRTEVLIPLVLGALKRGVRVQIVGDLYSKYEARTAKIAKRGPHLNWQQTSTINTRLAECGAAVTYIGKIGFNPFKGRCHSKITVVDDTVFTFGGVNFSDSHFSYKDLMIQIDDATFANRISHLVDKIAQDRPFTNISETIDNQSTLLFDGGNPRDSVIYETACTLIRSAKKVYFVSKMCPSGKLAKLLQQTDSTCYFNRPSQDGLPDNLAIIFDQIKYRVKNHYKRPEHIHAKLIMTEHADGSRHLITGSNNFSWRGIAFGTKEIALLTSDPQLYEAAFDFVQSEIM